MVGKIFKTVFVSMSYKEFSLLPMRSKIVTRKDLELHEKAQLLMEMIRARYIWLKSLSSLLSNTMNEASKKGSICSRLRKR
jgi:hypothetical protein